MIGENDIMVATAYNDTKGEEIMEQAVSKICNALKILNEHSVKHVFVPNSPEIRLIQAFDKNKEAKELPTNSQRVSM